MKEFSLLKLGNLPMFNRFIKIIVGRLNLIIVFDELYSFMNNNNLISKDQSGFRPGDSTINQLISITSSILNLLRILKKNVHYFLTSPKILIRFDTRALFSN